MRQSNTQLVAEQKPLGVIDVVSAGLDLVRRRPWTLAVPIALDLLLWVLPRLSLAQLLRSSLDESLRGLTLAADPETLEQTRQSLSQLLDTFNLLGFVSVALNTVARLPTLLALEPQVPSPIMALAYSTPLLSFGAAVLLFIPLYFLGLLAVALYLEMIAQGVRPLAEQKAGAWVWRVARLWLRLIGFTLFLVGFLFVLGLALALAQTVMGNAELASLLGIVVMVGVFWLLVYFFYVPAALAVSDIGLLEALRRSVLLYRVFFLAAIGLVGLSLFLDRGLALIWEGMLVSGIGVVVGIVLNAFIGTALLAASMVFYQDRLGAFERMRARYRTVKR